MISRVSPPAWRISTAITRPGASSCGSAPPISGHSTKAIEPGSM
jgi:hypothetical protein